MLALDSKNCDVYVGVNCGEQVWEAIHNARRTIRIISPYVENEYLKVLEQKHKNGVDVKLLTSDSAFEAKKYKHFSIANFFRQYRKENGEAKKRLEWLNGLYFLAGTMFSVLLVYLLYKIPSFKAFPVEEVVAIIIAFGLWQYFKSMIAKTQLYSYDYETTFPIGFYSYEKRQKGHFFMHSKIYIIDDIVYLGSFNFTKAGFRNNFETRITINDKQTVEAFIVLFNKLDAGVWFYYLDFIGRKFFAEPLN